MFEGGGLEMVGRDEEEEFFGWCLLRMNKAVVAEEGGLLLPLVDLCWSFEGVDGVDGDRLMALFDIVRCWEIFDGDDNKSAWECERPIWRWLDRNLANKIDEDGTDGALTVWRVKLVSLLSDSFEGLFRRLGV